MSKATVIIHNHTPVTFSLEPTADLEGGVWEKPPPQQIGPGGRHAVVARADDLGAIAGELGVIFGGDPGPVAGSLVYVSAPATDPSLGVVRESQRLAISFASALGASTCAATFATGRWAVDTGSPLTTVVKTTSPGRSPTWVVNVVMNPQYSAASTTPGGADVSYHGPRCTSWGADRLDLFSASEGADVLHRWYEDGLGWSPWETVTQPEARRAGQGLVTRWTATSWGRHRLDCFGIGRDGHVEHVWYQGGDDGPGWGQWDDLGGDGMAGGLSATASRVGRLDIVGLNSSNAVRHLSYSGGAWSQWSTVGVLGGMANPLMLTTVSPGPGLVDLFTVMADGVLWRAGFSEAGGWSGWVPIEALSPAPLDLNSGSLSGTFDGQRTRLFCVAVGGNLMQLRQHAFRVQGLEAGWGDWTYLATVDAGSSACTRGETVHVMARTGGLTVNTYLQMLEDEERVGVETLSP